MHAYIYIYVIHAFRLKNVRHEHYRVHATAPPQRDWSTRGDVNVYGPSYGMEVLHGDPGTSRIFVFRDLEVLRG